MFHSNTFLEESYDEDTNDMTSSKPLVAICEPQKTYPRFFDKEVDKLTENERFDLIETIVENESKTMMGILGAIRSKKVLRQYTPAQLQAMVHDVAVQEIRDEDKVRTKKQKIDDMIHPFRIGIQMVSQMSYLKYKYVYSVIL